MTINQQITDMFISQYDGITVFMGEDGIENPDGTTATITYPNIGVNWDSSLTGIQTRFEYILNSYIQNLTTVIPKPDNTDWHVFYDVAKINTNEVVLYAELQTV